MSDDNFLEGVTTGGDAFVLQKPSQVMFTTNGRCNSARDCFCDTVLEYLSTGAPPETISKTQLTSPEPCAFNNGASLRLPAGQYRWTTRIERNAGGELRGANLDVAAKQIYDDLVDPNAIGRAMVSGTSDGYITISVRAELAVFASALITGRLPPGERLWAALRITDQSNNSTVTTPRSILLGPNSRQLQTDAIPIYLQPNRLYRLSYDMVHGSSATMMGSVIASGG